MAWKYPCHFFLLWGAIPPFLTPASIPGFHPRFKDKKCLDQLVHFASHLETIHKHLKGGAWCKKYLSRKFFGALLQTAKKNSGPPFLPWKLRVNPIEKHVNSIFNGKSVVIFFRAPLTRVKNFKVPPLQVFVNGPLFSVLQETREGKKIKNLFYMGGFLSFVWHFLFKFQVANYKKRPSQNSSKSVKY